MFISSFFSSIGTIILWILGIGGGIFIIGVIIAIIKEHLSKPDKNQESYYDYYQKQSEQYLNRQKKTGSNCTTTNSSTATSDYEKHKDEVYYQVREKILSEGEKLLKPHLLKFIDEKQYILIDSPNYSRYLEPKKRAEKKYEAISASIIKGLVGDFGIETLDGKPVCIIEYDDCTHLAEERVQRDRFLYSACKHCGFPRISIKSKEYNSFKDLSKPDMNNFYKDLYRKFLEAGNPMKFPSLICDKCKEEFLVRVGDYGIFLSHSMDSDCSETVNVIDRRYKK